MTVTVSVDLVADHVVDPVDLVDLVVDPKLPVDLCVDLYLVLRLVEAFLLFTISGLCVVCVFCIVKCLDCNLCLGSTSGNLYLI